MKHCVRTYWLVLIVLTGLQVAAQPKQQQQGSVERPALVVGIVVDQMRWDYLYRYYDRYGEGGFKRLLNEGFTCENTFITHLPSFTAVGHTTVFTGSVPAIHGITGNEWIDQQTGRKWYCTDDTLVQTVGSTSDVGKMSPRNLLASTVTDELRIASNFQSKVVGVSIKDRAAILPAGHKPTGAFWFDDASGNFITSTWYMNGLPGWVKQFNDQQLPEKLLAKGWSTLYPVNTYTQSTPDDVAWEGLFSGETKSVFPHDMARFYKKNHGVLRSTPFGNTLTLDFARAAVEGHKLGSGPATDFLTVNCASTDYVGHMFGPNSIETEDTYLRLDKDLAAFFSFLDKRIGKDNYLVFLTADHGAAYSVDYLAANQVPSGFLETGEYMKRLNTLLNEQFHVPDLVRSGLNYHVNYDLQKIKEHALDYEAVKKVTTSFLEQLPGVQFAVDIDHIGEAPVPEPLKKMIINGYNKKRCGPVIIIPEPGWFEGFKKGTTHGNWNPYDTHIPLVFMGWGIRHGKLNRTTSMTDIAPTISALLHIPQPNGCMGEAISEVIRSTK